MSAAVTRWWWIRHAPVRDGGRIYGQSDLPCDCELSCEVAPDADRVIAPPPPLSDDMRSRILRRALYLSALLFGVLAGLLEAFGAEPFTRDLP